MLIAAFVSPDKVFLFLLIPSGAICPFALPADLPLPTADEAEDPARAAQQKMWLYPVLSLLTARSDRSGPGVHVRSCFFFCKSFCSSLAAILRRSRHARPAQDHRGSPPVRAGYRRRNPGRDKWMHEHGPSAELASSTPPSAN